MTQDQRGRSTRDEAGSAEGFRILSRFIGRMPNQQETEKLLAYMEGLQGQAFFRQMEDLNTEKVIALALLPGHTPTMEWARTEIQYRHGDSALDWILEERASRSQARAESSMEVVL